MKGEFVALIIAVVVLLFFGSMGQTTPESDFQTELSKDETYCLITGYTGYSEDIIIPTDIEGISVKVIADNAFYEKNNIQSVKLPNSVEKIGSCAFQGCTSLQNVVLSDSLEEVGRQAFYKCESLRSIYLPNSVKRIEAMAFLETPNLSEVKFPDSSIEIERDAFKDCGITELIVTSNLHFVGEGNDMWCFNNCNKLKSVVIEEDVINLPNHFLCSSTVKTITFKSPDTTIDMTSFFDCPNLTLTSQSEMRKHIK